MRLIDADVLQETLALISPGVSYNSVVFSKIIDKEPTVDAKTILNYIYGKESLGRGGIVFELDDTPEEIFKDEENKK